MGAEAVVILLRRRRPEGAPAPAHLPALAALGLATLIPLAYYAVLGKVDPSWSIDNSVDSFLDPPWSAILISIAPLALPAPLAYRVRPASFQDVVVRVWPVAALVLYWLLSSPFPGRFAPHALRGLSIPLAVLAVTGIGSLGLRPSRAWTAAAVAAIAILLVPGTLDRLDDFRQNASRDAGPYFLQQGERDALDYLDSNPTPGSVLAPVTMGQLIPSETGRRTNVGNIFWTPDFLRRRLFTDIVFRGRLDAHGTRQVVRASGSRFLMSGCEDYADLSKLIGPLLQSVHRFGCATVYEIKPSALRPAAA